jgi:hypothetical protein
MCTFDLHDEFEGINHDTYGTPESSLLKKVREAGHKPIAITVILCEETFIFKNKWDAEAAAAMFLPEGWWYDLNSWHQTREEYVKKFYEGDDDLAPTVYWLDNNFVPKSKK